MRGQVAAVAYDEHPFFVDYQRLVKAKLADAVRDLVDLLFGMLFGILPVGLDVD